MSKIIFSKICVEDEKIISIILDYKNAWRLLPSQISYKIIDEFGDQAEIEESILIEYHNEFEKLEEKLRNAQFSVRVEQNKMKEYKNKGYIFANRK